MKVAYIGIDLFYPALEKLKSLGCEIIEIFTCKVDNVCEFNLDICAFTDKYNIPIKKDPINHKDIQRLIIKGCDFAICGGYYFKIPHDTELPIVNIHPSLLPIGRGSWPMAQSILWRHKKSGVTIHKIAEGYDTGDILMQREFCLDKDETHKTFMDKVNTSLVGMLAELIENFDTLYKNAKPQGSGEYWKAPAEDDYTITSEMTVSQADLILRAFYGYECIYKNEDKRIIIIEGRAVLSNDLFDKEFPLLDGYITF